MIQQIIAVAQTYQSQHIASHCYTGHRCRTDISITTHCITLLRRSSLSDRHIKHKVQSLNTTTVAHVLLNNVSVSTWHYGAAAELDSGPGAATARRLGPMAQHMFGAFHLGGDERRISSIDADGVTLAALQVFLWMRLVACDEAPSQAPSPYAKSICMRIVARLLPLRVA